jgi:hypothetical protein
VGEEAAAAVGVQVMGWMAHMAIDMQDSFKNDEMSQTNPGDKSKCTVTCYIVSSVPFYLLLYA